jgi:hypothetical protein
MTMRVITTAHEEGYRQYGQGWLDSRKYWPAGTEFYWYTEGYALPYQPDEMQMIEQVGVGKIDGFIERNDLNFLTYFRQWKERHKDDPTPDWKHSAVKFSHKIFAMIEATKNYKGIAVWLDADCITYQKIPAGMIEDYVFESYIAHYWRPARWTETGFWVINCAHPVHKEFMEFMAWVYLEDKYQKLYHWTDCYVLDNAIDRFITQGKMTAYNLSGDQTLVGHPMAHSDLGQYIDHRKGGRKAFEASPENAHHQEYLEQRGGHEATC